MIRKYGGYLGSLAAPVAGAASIDPTGSTALAATGLKTAGWFSALFGRAETLDALKARIVAELHALQKQRPKLRFTVIIDDTDRLDVAEAVEVLRLARKAADFPLVSYVVCFDGRILSKQVETALSISNGREYLERIFQDVVHIPPQEPFALRRYLKRLLRNSFQTEMNAQDNEAQYRLEVVFDRWGGALLNTPRDVVRLHQAVQLAWPEVPKGSDFCDFVWLQLVKLKWPDFYAWVQNYVQNVGSYRDRGRPGDAESATAGKGLLTLLERFGWHERLFLSGLDEILPGLKQLRYSREGADFDVFKFEQGELEYFERGRRLGSPSHWRGYFAFALPTYAVKDSELFELRAACKSNPDAAASLIRSMLARPHERPGHFLGVLLDRLMDEPVGYDKEESAGLFYAFTETMDDVERTTGFNDTEGRNAIWETSRFLLRKNSPSNLIQVLKDGASLSWLSFIMRDQGFALGKPEGHRSNPENAWVTENDFQEAIAVTIGRFEHIGMKEIFELPAPLNPLFCWAQLGDQADVKARFLEATKTHAEFLKAVGTFKGWANSSNTGVHHPIHAQYIAYFADPDDVYARLNRLAFNGKPKHREVAKALLAEWVPLKPET
ncbi:hypothetical protein AOQ71_31880 [Bradyrhizobium manausense]|uniref:KAP NTPase domain-containing protein n=2 Tax=Bradyrhizobium manausense TaxID=989370 RepID=A0A0R3D452_9BRAD|nr:hypothetical protein AOQ71_31880 [Bradyrhizobium manausense]